MTIKENFNEYLANKDKYKDWENKRDTDAQKKKQYLKNNPVSIEEQKKYIKKAKNILNCIDVMDEYSQARAEDTELAIQTAQAPLMNLIATLGTAVGGLYLRFNKNANKYLKEITENHNLKNLNKLVIPALIFIVPIVVLSAIINVFSAKKEAQASRIGRLDAMENVLSNPNQFAVLTDEQENEVQKIAQNIKVDSNDVKKYIHNDSVSNTVKSIKGLFSPNVEEENRIKDFNNSVNRRYEENKKLDLTDEEIAQAKEDKQIIQNIVHKLDIASQDYAENTELATTLINMLTLGSGGILSAFFSKLKNVKNRYVKLFAIVVPIIATLAVSVYNTKVQKQASRVARYKIKQELLNNPESVIYVDDEKIKNIDVQLMPEKKQNFLQFIKEMYKNNAEYTEYIKEKGSSNIQYIKAREQIKLTPQQQKQAQQLQQNTFSMFNKLDEKSQQFSESTEAVGSVIQDIIYALSMLPVFIMTNKAQSGSIKSNDVLKSALTIAPAFLLNIFITKQQKKASRVASMLAMDETDDYKFFASKNAQNNKKITKSSNNSLNKAINKNQNFTQFYAK